eukprot:m.77001 g.77001  ORF g.77001 m.77001 type:complete len:1428 (+) comp50475_c1_seq1:1-4284(+)
METQELKPRPSALFQASPPQLTFDQYEPGQEVSATLTFTNTSDRMRQIRLVPPSTKYFKSTSLEEAANNRVAAGLSCSVVVTFFPDTRRSFEDTLTIHLEEGDPLLIPLRAERAKPNLELPSVIDFKTVFLGVAQPSMQVFRLVNKGAPSQFFLSASQDLTSSAFAAAASSPSTEGVPQPLQLGHFTLSPSSFSLATMESVDFTVSFAPQSPGKQLAKFSLYIDNGQRFDYTVCGGADDALVRLPTYDCAPAPMMFGPHFPNTRARKEFTIQSHSGIDLPFVAQVDNPAFHLDFTTSALAGHSQTVIGLTFEPKSVGTHRGKVQLTFKPAQEGLTFVDQPTVLQPNEANLLVVNFASTPLVFDCEGTCEPFAASLSPMLLMAPPCLVVGASWEATVTLRNESASSFSYAWKPKRIKAGHLKILPPAGSIAQSSSKTFQVIFSPFSAGYFEETVSCEVQQGDAYPIHIRGTVSGPELKFDDISFNFGLTRPSTSISKRIFFRNYSEIPAAWSLRLSSSGPLSDAFTFSPSAGQLPPFGEGSSLIWFNPKTCGNVDTVVALSVGSGKTQYAHLNASVQIPKVLAEESVVDMGVVHLQVPCTRDLRLRNCSALSAQFRVGALICTERTASASTTFLTHTEGDHTAVTVRSDLKKYISVHPTEGVIDPRQTTALVVSLQLDDLAVSRQFEFLVPVYIQYCHEPVLFKLQCQLEGLHVVYSTLCDLSAQPIGLPVAAPMKIDFSSNDVQAQPRRYLRIKNNSPVQAHYSFAVTGNPAKELEHSHQDFGLSTAPKSIKAGTLKGVSALKSETDTFRATDLKLLEPEDNLSKKTNRPKLSKTGSIPTAHPLSSTGMKPRLTSSAQQPTSQALVPQSAVGKVRTQTAVDAHESTVRSSALIPPGGCVAFQVLPAECILEPFGEVDVVVTAFHQLPGSFTDTLVCKTRLLPDQEIQLVAKAVGCPVYCQFGRFSDRTPPIVRLNPVTTSADTVQPFVVDALAGRSAFMPEDEDSTTSNEAVQSQVIRPLRIMNPTNVDLDMHWESFFSSPTDAQLVDCVFLEGVDGQISIRTVVHEGTLSDTPFAVAPARIRVAAHSSAVIHVRFASPKPGDHQGFLRGSVSLPSRFDSRASSGGEKWSVKVEFEPAVDTSLKILLLGRAVEPAVKCQLEDNKARFSCAAHQIAGRKLELKQSIVLTNAAPANTSFAIKALSPFSLDAVETQGGKSNSDVVVLTPAQTVKLLLSCCVDLNDIMASFLSREGDASSSPSRQLYQISHPGLEDDATHVQQPCVATHESVLTLRFSNKAEQQILLESRIDLPRVRADQSTLDFGFCTLAHEKRLSFVLENLGLSDCPFTVKMVSQTGQTFAIKSSEKGQLSGFTSKIADNRATVTVAFTPSQAQEFRAVVRIDSKLFPAPILISCVGSGSFDETHRPSS